MLVFRAIEHAKSSLLQLSFFKAPNCDQIAHEIAVAAELQHARELNFTHRYQHFQANDAIVDRSEREFAAFVHAVRLTSCVGAPLAPIAG